MNKVNKLFAEFKKNDLLEDRREYSQEDFQSTYGLNKKESKMLYLKCQKWAHTADKKNSKKHIKVR